jgi:acetaldehyde dehydrogenase (acetylating)
MDEDLRSIQEARHLALAAKAAGDAWATASQTHVDRVVAAVAGAGRAAASELAALAVKVTGYGRADHKEVKERYVTTEVYEAIAPLRTAGVVSSCPETGVVEIAEPVGVIGALIPTTNPVSTVLFKALIALKARNAIVMAPHPRAVEASLAAARVVADALRSAGAPDDLVSCMSEISLSGTNELMHHHRVSLLLATGSLAMVKAAYSSGKPTYAVGPGNVPVYVHGSADVDEAVDATLAGATFDYGTPCASEQAMIVDRSVERRARERLESLGARFLTDAEAERLAPVVITAQGGIHPEGVGRSPAALAERAGFTVDPRTTALVISPGGVGRDHPLSMEILSPTLKLYAVSGAEEGIERAGELLRFGGDGHTAGIWAKDERVIAAYASAARAFRVLVNTSTCFGAMGGSAGLPASIMLGTGSWGGSITADNIGPLHLINRKRVARGIRDWRSIPQTARSRAVTHTDAAAARGAPRVLPDELVRRVLERLDEPTGGRP